MDHLKMYFLKNMGIFHCHVSLLEGTPAKVARSLLVFGFRETRGAMSSSRQMSSKRIARSLWLGRKRRDLPRRPAVCFSKVCWIPKGKKHILPGKRTSFFLWGPKQKTNKPSFNLVDGHPQLPPVFLPWPLHPPLLTSELQTSNSGLIDTLRKGESGEVGGRTIHGFLNKKKDQLRCTLED